MSKAAIGDKVKFLNEKGGGVVTGFTNPNMAVVMSDDGFEIPVLLRDLVVYEKQQPNIETPQAEAPTSFRILSMNDLLPGVHLAYVMKPGSIVAGAADLYLLNNTAHGILYSIHQLKEGSHTPFASGQLEGHTLGLIQICPLDSEERLLRGYVQIIFHGKGKSGIIQPLMSEFRVRPTRLLETDNYKRYSLFESPAILIHLGSADSLLTESPVAAPLPARHEQLIKPYINSEGVAVVDLHIEAISQSPGSLTAAESLQMQLAHFEALLGAAIRTGLRKMVFIHGVGGGILKAEIRKRLGEVTGLVYFDAPMRQYGVGATEVLLG